MHTPEFTQELLGYLKNDPKSKKLNEKQTSKLYETKQTEWQNKVQLNQKVMIYVPTNDIKNNNNNNNTFSHKKFDNSSYGSMDGYYSNNDDSNNNSNNTDNTLCRGQITYVGNKSGNGWVKVFCKVTDKTYECYLSTCTFLLNWYKLMYRNENNNNMYNENDDKKKLFVLKENNILHCWINMIDLIHNKNCLIIEPSKFRQCLGKQNSEFCDGEEHDAFHALLCTLQGIQSDFNQLPMNNNSNNNGNDNEMKIFRLATQNCIFDEKENQSIAAYNNSKSIDEEILKLLQRQGKFEIENSNNIVTKYFTHVQFTQVKFH